jgi:hypothetical protein
VHDRPKENPAVTTDCFDTMTRARGVVPRRTALDALLGAGLTTVLTHLGCAGTVAR